MVAKAVYENSTSWISLARALELFVEVYRSPRLAERLLWEALGAKKIHWRGLERGRRRDVDPGNGDAGFWKGGPSIKLQGRLREGWVRRVTYSSPRRRVVVQSTYLRGEGTGEAAARPATLSDYMFYAIEVVREDVVATLPATALKLPEIVTETLLAPYAGSEAPNSRRQPAWTPHRKVGRPPALTPREIKTARAIVRRADREHRRHHPRQKLKISSALDLLRNTMKRDGKPIVVSDTVWKEKVVWPVLRPDKINNN